MCMAIFWTIGSLVRKFYYIQIMLKNKEEFLNDLLALMLVLSKKMFNAA